MPGGTRSSCCFLGASLEVCLRSEPGTGFPPWVKGQEGPWPVSVVSIQDSQALSSLVALLGTGPKTLLRIRNNTSVRKSGQFWVLSPDLSPLCSTRVCGRATPARPLWNQFRETFTLSTAIDGELEKLRKMSALDASQAR